MKVLIVAKTHMSNAMCIGALTDKGNKNVRLLTPGGNNQPVDTKYDVGQVWDVEFKPQYEITAPHCEDVLVYQSEYVYTARSVNQALLKRIHPWQGGYTNLFDGLVRFTRNGSGYISERIGVPSQSVGFWMITRPMKLHEWDGKRYYGFDGHKARLPYVGYDDFQDTIPAGTVLRISLARWWKPSEADTSLESRCYLQLSGWYLN
jgi:hypothetical protein